MIKMLRHDIVSHPTSDQMDALNGKKTRAPALSKVNENKKALEVDGLDDISEDEMNNARALLNDEIQIVKSAMAHGDLALEVYSKVWEECFGQVGGIHRIRI